MLGRRFGEDARASKSVAPVSCKCGRGMPRPYLKEPKFIRFAWHCEARHNLMNQEGLPAVSFRTDTETK